MRTLKISLLFFILSISNSAQETGLMYSPLCENRKVLFADGFESIVEFKCYEEESDTGDNFIILSKIRNFSNEDIIWDLTKSEIYSSEEQFKPVGYQININIYNSLPEILSLQAIEEIEVKSKSSLSILIFFSKWENNDRYETILDDVDADIIVGTASLKNNRKEEYIFRMSYFKKGC